MIGTWPNLPNNWSFYVHRTTRDHPLYPYGPETDHLYRMVGPSSVRDLGEWNGDTSAHLFEVRFDNIGLRLDPGWLHYGVYWFAPDGYVPGYPQQRVWWGSAGDGEISGEEGWGRLVPYQWPGWTPLGDDDFPSSDYAMRIEGHHVSDYVPPDTVLTDFELITGEHLEGELYDIRHTDEARMRLLTRQQPHRHDPRVKYIVRALALVDEPDFIDITIAQTLDANNGDCFIRLYNWRTAEYDAVHSYPLGRTENTIPIRDIPADDYINDDDEIEMMVENVQDTYVLRLSYGTEATINRIRFELRHAH